MILSFHPCFVADTNIIVAGRDPGKRERTAIQAADAVILPQGCREVLWTLAAENCAHVFPDYRARFKYPGKTGQAVLFQQLGAPFPETRVYPSVADFYRQHPPGDAAAPRALPLVFKFDWGGEGDNVMRIDTAAPCVWWLSISC